MNGAISSDLDFKVTIGAYYSSSNNLKMVQYKIELQLQRQTNSKSYINQ